MKPQEIELTTTSKMFAYETMAREIDKVDDPEVLRDLAKSYAKLYLKQQETIVSIGNMV